MSVKKAYLAGLLIGLGGLVYLSVENKVIGSFLFSLGLVGVLVLSADLYTGWVSKPWKYKNPAQMLEVFIMNYMGALTIAVLTWTKPQIVEAAKILANNKLDTNLIQWFVSSVICGFFIAIAVRGWDALQIGLEKVEPCYLLVVLGVMGFICCGSDHVIADIYYFSAGMMINAQSIFRIFLCAFGNMIGGLVIGLLLKPEKE